MQGTGRCRHLPSVRSVQFENGLSRQLSKVIYHGTNVADEVVKIRRFMMASALTYAPLIVAQRCNAYIGQAMGYCPKDVRHIHRRGVAVPILRA